MFLLVTPNETSFETLEQVPKYVDEVRIYDNHQGSGS